MPDPVLALGLVVGFVVLGYEIQDELFDDDLEDSLVDSPWLLAGALLVLAWQTVKAWRAPEKQTSLIIRAYSGGHN